MSKSLQEELQDCAKDAENQDEVRSHFSYVPLIPHKAPEFKITRCEIEEMAKLIEEAMAKARRTLGGHNNIAMFYATMLANAGYRKIPEGSVVLTREELAQIQSNFFDAGIKHGSKETAEKFAERLKAELDISVIGYSTSEVMSEIEDKIDEICKDITGG